MTQGERQFEAFCDHEGFPFRRIPESGVSKTADYEVSLAGTGIVVEVKDLTDNPEDHDAARRVATKGWAVWGTSTVGGRIRHAIVDAHGQLKHGAADRAPTVLLVYDARSFEVAPVTSYEIAAAMYGYETLDLADIGTVNRRFGSRRQMTPTTRRYISAVGVLRSDPPIELFLNWYADRRLPIERLARHPAIAVYRLGSDPQTRFTEWQRVEAGTE